MVIEAEVQIKKQILIKIIDDDVDGFMEDLDLIFKNAEEITLTSKRDEDFSVTTGNHKAPTVFPTLYKIWLEVKQQL